MTVSTKWTAKVWSAKWTVCLYSPKELHSKSQSLFNASTTHCRVSGFSALQGKLSLVTFKSFKCRCCCWSLCTVLTDQGTITVQCRPFYLPREFTSLVLWLQGYLLNHVNMTFCWTDWAAPTALCTEIHEQTDVVILPKKKSNLKSSPHNNVHIILC
jgi:hypothetical protein